MSSLLEIEYFNDVLCVWAWIAERRNQELMKDWNAQVHLNHHFLDLFSDTETRIGKGWENKGGYAGFGHHVREAAEPYLKEPVHAKVWDEVRPTTSANAHLVVHAARIVSSTEQAELLVGDFRKAFFSEAADIGQLEVLYEIAQGRGLAENDLRAALRSGRALAGLLGDMKMSHERKVKGSPTWILNQGRQTLYGNVGYRVLQANIEELLKRPAHEASWC